MTFKESMIKTLVNMGMFESQANKVLEIFMNHESSKEMEGRWNDDISSYPPVIQNAIWVGVKHFAYEWIKDNVPKAWYLPMFRPDYEN